MRKATAILVLLLTAAMLVGATPFETANANPTMFGHARYCDISTESPKNGTTLNAQSIALNFTVTEVKMASDYTYFYLLDTQDLQHGIKVQNLSSVSNETVTNDTFFSYEKQTFAGEAILPVLTSGSHNLTVFIGYSTGDGTIKAANVEPFSSTISFNIDNKTVAPSQATGISNVLNNQEDLSILVVAVPIVIIAVASLLLVHFKRSEETKRLAFPLSDEVERCISSGDFCPRYFSIYHYAVLSCAKLRHIRVT